MRYLNYEVKTMTDEELAFFTSYHKPDETVIVNAAGGKQSYVDARYDLLPPVALDKIAKVLHTGAIKYGDNNWHLIPTHEHLNHAIRHAFQYLLSPNDEDLSHAATRLLFALHTHHDTPTKDVPVSDHTHRANPGTSGRVNNTNRVP